jgi:beta-1,4-mannooligosaccharide/beta-1,4-mannosyl-N-acetylglucosamine phosphorylase
MVARQSWYSAAMLPTPPERIERPLTSAACIRRRPRPVLTRDDVPYPSDLVFNAGVCKHQGRYVMVFRNDFGLHDGHRFAGTNLGLAFSDDGIAWRVQPKPCFAMSGGDIRRAYDPRLTVVDGRVYMCFAVDTDHGVRGGIAVTDDFERFEVLSISVPDNRNMVLLPQRIDGMWVRLERPMPVYGRGGRHRFDVWLSRSPDLRYWGESRLVLGGEHVWYCNDKVGPAAPPVRTPQGWLTTFHAVDIDDRRGKNGYEPTWKKRYSAGIMLLDLQEPWKVRGLCRDPLIAPQAPYETAGGFRNDVIFPGGMTLEDSGEVKIYYGAADTVEAMATAHVDDLVKLCLEGGPPQQF